MRWLGLERQRPLDSRAVLRIAWALDADPRQLGTRLVMQDGGRTGWVRYAGARFSREVATSKLCAKVCPQCLREHGVAKLSWQLRAAVGCAQHGYSLIWLCPHCSQTIGWNRPDVDICRCGRHFKAEPAVPLEPGVQAWLSWLEGAMIDALPPVSAALPTAVRYLSIDGAFRIVEALGLRASPGVSIRPALVDGKTPRGLGVVVQRGLERLKAIEADAGVPMRLSGVADRQALEQIAADAAAESDSTLAWLLSQSMSSGMHAGSTRASPRLPGQLPLFDA